MKRTFLTVVVKAAGIATLAAFGVASSFTAAAQTWPDKPVRVVLSHPAGSGVDSIARLVTERLGKMWGQAVVVDNKPGGQNVIGAQAVQHAAPDGYTFYFSTVASLVTNSYLFKNLPYDTQRDFAPVAFVATSPFGVAVRTESPIKTIEELIAKGKSNPGKVSIANEGPKTLSGMTSRYFAYKARTDFNQISYVSIGVAIQDTLGGQTDALVSDLASTAPLIKQGRLRLLATASAKRATGWEQVPALAELLPGFDMSGWFAFVAPIGTPKAIIDKANKDINTVLADKDIAERIHTIGPVVEGTGSPDDLATFFKQQNARWAEVTKEIGLLPE